MVSKKILKIALLITAVLSVLAAALYFNGDIGISRGILERDIRSQQKIDDSWQVTGNVSDSMAAFITYPDDKSDHTFSVYVNRPGMSFGYFFRGGGSLQSVKCTVSQFTVENCPDQAFITMNMNHIVKAEIDDGNSVETIEFKENEPFAIVLPQNCGTVTFFDYNGDSVEYIRQKL